MHIVVFPGWYPSRVDKLSGDFIQRHLQAIAKNATVSVVFPVKDNSIQKEEEVVIKNGNLTEYYHYYPSLNSIKWLDTILSFIRYNYTCIKATKAIRQKEQIDLAHLYVIQKNQLVGLLLKLFFKIPYVVSEQSTIYVNGRFEEMSSLQQQFWKFVFRKAKILPCCIKIPSQYT